MLINVRTCLEKVATTKIKVGNKKCKAVKILKLCLMRIKCHGVFEGLRDKLLTYICLLTVK